ncbi:MAG: site-specific integrase [Pseudomonadota bacterium]
MATVANRSRFSVTVARRPDLARTFPYSAEKKAHDYAAELKGRGLAPRLARLDDRFEVKIRNKTGPDQCITVGSYEEADLVVKQIESERRRGLFVDYTLGWKTRFADLLRRYLREEAPRLKSFETIAYRINGMLEDAGLPREDLAAVLAAHRNPHPNLAKLGKRRVVGNTVRTPLPTMKWINKPFAQLLPEDFETYIADRCEEVAPSTVDRELDVFSAVCNVAIDTWRIHVAKNPMHGVRRPKYFNERDRRVRADEEAALMRHATDADRAWSIERRFGQLMAEAHAEAALAPTVYARKAVVKEARAIHRPAAEASFDPVPIFSAFIQFQLMTGARRGETLSLEWQHVDLERQTAYLPETKNGRPRTLPLRRELVELLLLLPRNGNLVFPISTTVLNQVWRRICEAAGFVGEREIRIHDLRHEAISRVADTGTMSMLDLQAFSGHRDVRMLLRYAHLCAEHMAKRLDEAFACRDGHTVHRGFRRLTKASGITMSDLMTAPLPKAAQDTAPESLPGNVIRFPGAVARKAG